MHGSAGIMGEGRKLFPEGRYWQEKAEPGGQMYDGAGEMSEGGHGGTAQGRQLRYYE